MELSKDPAGKAANGLRTAVFQPLPGIGDLIWHLPHIHAIAKSVPSGQITLVTKPRSRADRLLAADPHIEDVVWIDRGRNDNTKGPHDGVLGLMRCAQMLRGHDLDRAIILHSSHRYALASRLAGVHERAGYGFGGQRRHLTAGPFLDPGLQQAHAIEKADAYVRALGLTCDGVPKLLLGDATLALGRTFAAARKGPLLAAGIGASEAYKRWKPERYAALLTNLLDDGWGSVLLVGGPDDGKIADAITKSAGADPSRFVPVVGLDICETAAIIAHCGLFVGNDTGFLSIAAAVGVPSVGIFGALPPFPLPPLIRAVTPPGNRFSAATGMDEISVQAVKAAADVFGRPCSPEDAGRTVQTGAL